MSAPLALSRPRSAPRPAPPRPGAPQNVSRVVNGALSTTQVEVGGDEERSRIVATAKSLAVACLEIFAGVRRSDSVAKWVDPDLLRRIDERAALRAEVTARRNSSIRSPAARVRAGAVRVCMIDRSTAEVCVIVRTPHRFRAVAIRLEQLTTRWTMTQLQTM